MQNQLARDGVRQAVTSHGDGLPTRRRGGGGRTHIHRRGQRGPQQTQVQGHQEVRSKCMWTGVVGCESAEL